MNKNDAIVALATPPGVAGLAVIRVSGDNTFEIVAKIFSGKSNFSEFKTHTIHFGNITDNGEIVDNVTASIFRSPQSYTGEDVVEISCHGGMLVTNTIISLLIKNGCRLAEPGEFTKRAFLNGKLDLTQVEAVADIIHSSSTVANQIIARQLQGKFKERIVEYRKKLINICSLLELENDFSDDDIELIEKTQIIDQINEASFYCNKLNESHKTAEILRSGFFVGITGYPNSGKSTLFNALLNRDRAIVSHIEGTTRDFLEESMFVDGITLKLIDTAGIRQTDNLIEIAGIKLAEEALKQSDLILVINDISISGSHSLPLMEKLKQKYPQTPIILIQNKIDKIENPKVNKDEFYLSAKKRIGVDELINEIVQIAKSGTEHLKDVLLNQRQSILLQESSYFLALASASLKSGEWNELISYNIQKAADAMGQITGEKFSYEVLNNIFSRFCIGK